MNARVVGLLVAVVVLSACRPRQVDVRTAPPQQQAQVTVEVNNTLTQGVNIYITLNKTDTFLRQVGPKSKETIPVQGFAPGSSVTLKATTLDGIKTYERQNVVLTGTVAFPLP
jgi:hypothetical protein